MRNFNNGTPISWAEVDELTECLAKKIIDSGFRPTMIAAIPRGGWPVATLLAQYLNIKKVVGIAQEKNADKITTYLAYPNTISDESILVVDDSIESGKSLHDGYVDLKKINPNVKTAALLVTTSGIKPDFYLYETIIPDFPWDMAKPII